VRREKFTFDEGVIVMNLYDIVKRKDRTLHVVGNVQLLEVSKPENVYVVLVHPGSAVTLRAAHEFTTLNTFPRDLGWRVSPERQEPATDSSMHVEIVIASRRNRLEIRLFEYQGALKEVTPLLTWPHWSAEREGYDLSIRNKGETPLRFVTGFAFNPRSALRDLLVGTGVEVGPGSNPFVLPAPGVEVRYIESMPAEEWLKTYGKGREPSQEEQARWDRFIIGDAHHIECCDDGSLDFIFSSHVFEHLMNPLGVLANWSRKLKPGGVIVGVTPDCRYCFDLRQTPSTIAEWIAERDGEIWTPTRAKYEKWCQSTAPYNTVEQLIARNYSIHTHYYTPATFRELIQQARAEGHLSRAFLNTSPNNKDFGFALWR
jgi:SAM-dependent methyltransferase